MRYRLRTLLIVLALGPPILAVVLSHPVVVLLSAMVILSALGVFWLARLINAIVIRSAPSLPPARHYVPTDDRIVIGIYAAMGLAFLLFCLSNPEFRRLLVAYWMP